MTSTSPSAHQHTDAGRPVAEHDQDPAERGDATTPENRDDNAPDPDLDAAAAELAEGDATVWRGEWPRTDAKGSALLSVLTALIAAGGLVGALLPRPASVPWVAVGTLSLAAAVAFTALVLLVLILVPNMRTGPMRTLAGLADTEAARAYYRSAAADPLGHHAERSRAFAQVTVRRYRRIQVAAWVELAAVGLVLVGFAALVGGW